MTEWQFWGDRQILSVYGNIYLRTFVADWFKIVDKLAKFVRGKKILDLGCGEGHTTKQILDRLNSEYVCDLVEPNKNALALAKSFLEFENKIGASFVDTLSSFNPKGQYDTVFTSHTNYYWADEETDFRKQLDKLLTLLSKKGRLLILTLPEKSDHYNVMIKQIYPKFNYSEYIANYYKSKGLKIKIVKFKMRMFVEDIVSNKGSFELQNFYRFIHNTETAPSKEEGKNFLEKIKRFQKKGYLDFRDELIIVEKD